MPNPICEILVLSLFAFAVAGCGKNSEPPPSPPGGFSITSAAFRNGQPIPREYTCDGKDSAPPLAFSNVPKDAKSLALICDDPDAPAGTWVHWVVYSLPPVTSGIDSGAPMAGGTRQGTNDFKRVGYGGPCPPPGKPHRYFFRLYALDQEITLPPGATRKQLDDAMKGHILARAELMGTYQRR